MRGCAALGGEPLQHAHRLVGVDAALDQHLERLASELIDHVEQLQHPPVGGLVELKIERPHLVGTLRPQALRRNRRLAQPAALALALRHPQPLLPPQALHPLAIHLPALLPQVMVRTAVPPAWTALGELAQLGAQRRVILTRLGLVTLRGAMLADHPACPALADAETVAQDRDRPAPADWAYQFPLAISFSATTSSSLSATIRFNVAFSRSSSFSRFASS